MTEPEIQELIAQLDAHSAKLKAIIDNPGPATIEAQQRAPLRKASKLAAEDLHLVYQDLNSLNFTGMTMLPVQKVKDTLSDAARRLRQIADQLTSTVWGVK